jgi:aarF domain-containing kinase
VKGAPVKLRRYVLSEALLDTQGILTTLFEVHGYQVFINGSFNGGCACCKMCIQCTSERLHDGLLYAGDPHPGNILLTPDGRLGLIDYGQVKHMTGAQRRKLARLIVALKHGHKEDVRVVCKMQLVSWLMIMAQVVKAYTDLGFRTKYMNPDVLYAHANVFFNLDDPETLGGTNVQVCF